MEKVSVKFVSVYTTTTPKTTKYLISMILYIRAMLHDVGNKI